MRQLQAQIAMTPRGQYRDGLETHLEETRRTPSASRAGWPSLGRATTCFRPGSVPWRAS